MFDCGVLELDIPHVVTVCRFTRTIATARSKFKKGSERCYAITKIDTFLRIGIFNSSIHIVALCVHVVVMTYQL